ncbi:MAG: tRNA threonylcarbamoyladenosine biosynthesis protein TsaE [Acidimicrobiaceae bacterium]|nr:tRNA threonylcarbamoyladenosine biosynthesis protein TsaE [Acidimicrobiaceae bacterium]
MITAQTKSVDDTRELAAALAGLAKPGDLILLAGDLGSGKTAFAQGFGAGLGVQEPVVSPTFTLVRTYQGRLTLVHCDVYRLDHLQEVIDLGLAESLDDGGVALIEWGDMAAPSLPADFLEVRLEFSDDQPHDPGRPSTDADDNERILRLRVVGPTWAPRQAAIVAALGRWAQ